MRSVHSVCTQRLLAVVVTGVLTAGCGGEDEDEQRQSSHPIEPAKAASHVGGDGTVGKADASIGQRPQNPNLAGQIVVFHNRATLTADSRVEQLERVNDESVRFGGYTILKYRRGSQIITVTDRNCEKEELMLAGRKVTGRHFTIDPNGDLVSTVGVGEPIRRELTNR